MPCTRISSLQAFYRATNAVVDLQQGLPSLRCLGSDAFYLMYGDFSIRMEGGFPCFNPTLGSVWNSLTGQNFHHPPDIGAFDFEVQACPEGDAAVSAICHPTNEIQCTAPYLDDTRIETCTAVEDDFDVDFDYLPSQRTPIPPCALLMRNGQAVCESLKGAVGINLLEDLTSDCNPTHGDDLAPYPCQRLNTTIVIGSRDDLQIIADFAFADYGGTIKMSGEFKSLTHIGSNAFGVAPGSGVEEIPSCDQALPSSNSLLVFGRNSLPVLVEIGFSAFFKFRGTIQFFDNPFPKLQSIQANAFDHGAWCRGTSSMLEVDNLNALASIGKTAFRRFQGVVEVTGAMPALRGIAAESFQCLTNRSAVDIRDLWSLKTIGYLAFSSGYGGASVSLSGGAPQLTAIDPSAFNDNVNAIILNITCVLDKDTFDGSSSSVDDATATSANIINEWMDEPNPLRSCTCDDWPCEYFDIPAVTPTSTAPCVLLIRNGQAVCETADTIVDDVISDCAPAIFGDAPEAYPCKSLDSKVTIDSHEHMQAIAPFAFASFGGTIKMKGQFRSLTHIGDFAFAIDGLNTYTSGLHDPACRPDTERHSSLIFGSNSLPVLVEIGFGAFWRFRGTIQFVDNPFPKLQRILSQAFDAGAICHPSSEVELIDLDSLVSIGAQAFELFYGTAKVTGAMPSLTSIAYRAFQFVNAGSVVDIGTLYSLKTISYWAFSSDDGLFRLSGAAPQLTVVDATAFSDNTNQDSLLNITCVQDAATFKISSSQYVPTAAAAKLFETWTGSLRSCTCDDWDCQYFATTAPKTIQGNPTTKSNAYPTITVIDSSKTSSRSPAIAAGAIAAVLVLLIIGVVAAIRRRRHTAKQEQERAKLATDVLGLARNKLLTKLDHLFSGGPDQAAAGAGGRALAVQNMARWLAESTVKASSVTLGVKLGDGRFGTLHSATLVNAPGRGAEGQPVVVKACGTAGLAHQARIRQDDIELLAMFSAESYLIGALTHPHILPVVGVIMNTIPMQVMTEHMQNGDLKSYLRACRPTSQTAKEKLSATKLLEVCSQVASACVYLEQLKVVHRGLMTSNCMVGGNYMQIKLSGFGSLREVLRAEEYVKTSGAKETDLDIRWMATECFTYNTFSTKSDVWSFAVLMWEVFSFARKPFGAFHPHEIAAEVRAGRRLERAEGCPVELHDWIERCWSAVPNNRPTFAALQGTIRLLLLEDADELRAKVAAATKFRPEAQAQAMRWVLGMRGWTPSPVGPTDCGSYQLARYFAIPEAPANGSVAADASAVEARLGMSIDATINNTVDAAALKAIFNVLVDLQHPNVVQLLGSSIIKRLVVVFHDCPFTLGEALHPHRTQSIPPGTNFASARPGVPVLLRSTDSKVEAARQMALGIEYVHGQQYVHGRLSSSSFYFNGDGTQLRLFLGNILHHQQHEQRTQPHAQHQLPLNIRWLPYEAVGLTHDGMQQAPSATSDVYGFGVLLWELFACEIQADHTTDGYIDDVVSGPIGQVIAVAETSFGGGGLPHSNAFPTDAELFTAIVAQHQIPALAAPSWSTDADQAVLLSNMFTGCVQHNPHDRPSIFKVATHFLDAGSNGRWEQDRSQLKFVEQLGSGQFGDVQKMATRLFSVDQSLEFVAVKTLKASVGTSAAVLAAFEQEINMMKQIRHPNLVRLLGVCTHAEPHYMILEFSAGGSLNEWLPVNGPLLLETSFATKEVYLLHPATRLMYLLHQVALGMSALGRMNIIHRDLAARNVLVSYNLSVKVADFGLSRDVEVDSDYIYMMKSDQPIPLKWTSPEAIKEKKYSTASDVYSFGVLCFEVFSFGKGPFTAYRAQMKFVYFLSQGTDPIHQPLMVQIADTLTAHGVLGVPPVVEALLEGCLYREAAERLTFTQVVELTGRAARDGVPIKRHAVEAVVGGAVAVGAAGGGGGGGAGAVVGADAVVSAGAGDGYSFCDTDSVLPATDTVAAGSGYSTCVEEYAAGAALHDQTATGGYSHGLSDVADEAILNVAQEEAGDTTRFDLAASIGGADVPVDLEGSTIEERDTSPPSSSSYIAGFDLAAIIGDTSVAAEHDEQTTKEVVLRDERTSSDDGYLGVEGTVASVGAARAASGAKTARPLSFCDGFGTVTSLASVYAGYDGGEEEGGVNIPVGGEGDYADAEIALAHVAADAAVARSITRRRKPSMYLGFEAGKDDAETRL
jgi:serine/threonine protein kinase